MYVFQILYVFMIFLENCYQCSVNSINKIVANIVNVCDVFVVRRVDYFIVQAPFHNANIYKRREVKKYIFFLHLSF